MNKYIELTKEEQKALAEKKSLTPKDYELIFRVYHPRVYNFIRTRITKKEDVEDITSLVFERVLKKLQDFQWQGTTITSWIFRIARNAIIDHYRKFSERAKDPSVEDVGEYVPSTELRLDTQLINGEEESALYNAIREFKQEDQFLIYYKFFEERSNQAISEITGISETNVGTRLHRIRTKLRALIETTQSSYD
jgi:RNA polymerase sigma factor (sigma-70 family)